MCLGNASLVGKPCRAARLELFADRLDVAGRRQLMGIAHGEEQAIGLTVSLEVARLLEEAHEARMGVPRRGYPAGWQLSGHERSTSWYE